jgi:hypothetical protein
MTRSQLVRYKLLRAQLAILVSSVLLTVVLRRGGAFGGSLEDVFFRATGDIDGDGAGATGARAG